MHYTRGGHDAESMGNTARPEAQTSQLRGGSGQGMRETASAEGGLRDTPLSEAEETGDHASDGTRRQGAIKLGDTPATVGTTADDGAVANGDTPEDSQKSDAGNQPGEAHEKVWMCLRCCGTR